VPCLTLDQWIQVSIAAGTWASAIATFSAVVVSLWLASRKPKGHLAVSVALQRGDLEILIRTVGKGAIQLMVEKYELLSPALKLGRIDILVEYAIANSQRIQMGVARLTNGDWQEAYCSLHTLGSHANAALPADLTGDQLEATVRNSSILCVTTTGESFRAPLPVPVQRALVRSINMQRQLAP
jgi:hypothetical protein